MTRRALFAILSIILPSMPAAGSSSPGLVAQWSEDVSHASKLGHIDWETWNDTGVVEDINFTQTRGPFFAGGPSDHFAARFVGQVDVPTTGDWNFSLESDQGAQLFINGELIINDADPHGYRSKTGSTSLTAGTHEIEVRYWDSTSDAGLVLGWAGPGTDLQVIPASAFSHTGNEAAYDLGGEGLWAYWYRNLRNTSGVGQIDWSSPDRKTQTSRIAFPLTGSSFVAGEAADSFGAKFVGVINVPETGEWSFELGSDQSAELLINGQPVVTDQASHTFRWRTGKTNLTAGDHTIEVRFWDGWSAAGLFVAWQGPSDDFASIIPSSAFRPGSGAGDPASGEGLTAYWYDNVRHASGVGQVDWSRHDRVGHVEKVYWPTTARGFDADGPTDYFATRLVGYIDVPSSGNWTFNLGSDQSARLFVNGELVVDDAANHTMRWREGNIKLSAGRHPIEVQHWEGWATTSLMLTWTPPGSDREEVIPAAAFSPRVIENDIADANGLRVFWVDNARHAEQVGHIDFQDYDRTSMTPNVSWGLTSEAFEEDAPSDYVGLRARGQITLPESGTWSFGLGSDQSARLFIDGKLVIDDASGHPFRWRSGSVRLNAGKYDFEIRHWEGWSNGGLVATWTPPSGSEEVIPQSAFSVLPEEAALEAPNGGLRAYWITNARHAQNVGQVDWDRHDFVTNVENIAFPVSEEPFIDAVPADHVAVRFRGRINVPSYGTWTFNLGSDQSATLAINGKPVVTDATGHGYRWRAGKIALNAGWHEIDIRHLEGWSTAGLHLAWSGPGVPEQLVPRSAFAHPTTEDVPDSGGGIQAFWTNDAFHAEHAGHLDVSDFDTQTVVDRISFDRGSVISNAGGMGDTFGARFIAELNVPESGLWTFGLGSDESAVLLINGEPLVADAESHTYRWRRGAINLAAGKHRFEVLYWDGSGEEGLHVTWQGPNDATESIIPANAFAMYTNDPGTDCPTTELHAKWYEINENDSLASLNWSSHEPVATSDHARLSWRQVGDAFAPGIDPTGYAVRIKGTIDVPYAGEWTFGLGSGGMGELSINGLPVVSDVGGHEFRWRRGTVILEGGRHDFEVILMNASPEEGLFATWTGPADAYEQIIPSCAFSSTTRVRVTRTRELVTVPTEVTVVEED